MVYFVGPPHEKFLVAPLSQIGSSQQSTDY